MSQGSEFTGSRKREWGAPGTPTPTLQNGWRIRIFGPRDLLGDNVFVFSHYKNEYTSKGKFGKYRKL